jgi:hypothetical protein
VHLSVRKSPLCSKDSKRFIESVYSNQNAEVFTSEYYLRTSLLEDIARCTPGKLLCECFFLLFADVIHLYAIGFQVIIFGHDNSNKDGNFVPLSHAFPSGVDKKNRVGPQLNSNAQIFSLLHHSEVYFELLVPKQNW